MSLELGASLESAGMLGGIAMKRCALDYSVIVPWGELSPRGRVLSIRNETVTRHCKRYSRCVWLALHE